MEAHSRTSGTTLARLAAALLTLAAALALLLQPAPASAASTTCTQADGAQFRADWVSTPNLTYDITNLRWREPGGSWTNYTDTWGRVAKLEWWTGSSLHHLVTQQDSPWNRAGATFVNGQAAYDRWYSAVDQRAAVLATNPYVFTQPKITNRNNGSGLARSADLCNLFLGDWPSEAGPRVAFAGDSITVQMTKQFLTRDFEPATPGRDWRPFVEPQSGQSFTGMQGEIRGLAAGLRDPVSGLQTKPDSLVLALGTNDANIIASKPTQAERDNALTAFQMYLAAAIIASEEVECKVLVTVHESGWNNVDGQAVWDGVQKEARQDINAVLRQVAADRADVTLVDWAQMSAEHGWFGSPGVDWYDPAGGNYHPNGTGLEVLSNEIYDAATGECG